ncbi:MAG: hypothetical protein ACD_45C00737G0011, partial [uncultured bacterium]
MNKKIIFGKNNYVMPFIKTKSGNEIATFYLTNAIKQQLLNQAKEQDVSHQVAAALYMTEQEFQQIDQYHRLFTNNTLRLIKHDYHFEADLIRDDETTKSYYEVNLDELFPNIESQNGSYWISVKNAENHIADIQINNGNIIIYNTKPIAIRGRNRHHSLIVNGSTTVKISSDLDIEDNILIHSKKLLIDKSVKEIKANQFYVYTTDTCQTNGKIKVNSFLIKSALFDMQGFIEADNQVLILAHTTLQKGDIFSKNGKGIVAISENWVAESVQANQSATLHSPEMIQLLCKNFEHKGCISTKKLMINAEQALFSGLLFVSEATYIHAERYSENTNSAEFWLNGYVHQSSELTAVFAGQIFYSKELDVSWKKIAYANAKSNHEVIEHPDKLNNLMRLHAGLHMDLSGEIYAREVDIIFSSENILFSGKIWHDVGMFNDHSLHFQGNDLLHDGDLHSNGTVNFALTNDFNQFGKTLAENVGVTSRHFVLHSGAVVNSKTLSAQTKKIFHAKPGSEIKSKFTSIQAQDIFLRGNFKSDTVSLEAKRLIALTGHQNIHDLYSIAPLFFSVGDLSVSNRLTTTSYLSLYLGLIKAGCVQNTSLININFLSIFLQNSLPTLSPTTILTTLIATSLSVGNLIAPAILPITIPAQITISSLLQLYSAYFLARNAKASFEKLTDNASSANLLTAMAAFNLLFMSVATSAITTDFYTSLDIFKNINLPENVTFTNPELNQVMQILENSGCRLVSGNNNTTILNLSVMDFLAGVGSTNSSIATANFGGELALSDMNTSMFALNSDFNFILGSSVNNDYIRYDFGNTYALGGNSVTTYEKLILNPLISTGLPYFGAYNNWSIHTKDLEYPDKNIFGQWNNPIFNSGAITATVHNNTQLSINGSYITGSIINNGKADLENCSINATPKLKGGDGVAVIQNNKDLFIKNSLVTGDITNTGKAEIESSSINSTIINDNELTIVSSKVNGNITNKGKAEFAGCNIDSRFDNSGQAYVYASTIKGSLFNNGVAVIAKSEFSFDKIETRKGLQFILSKGSIDSLNVDKKTVFAVDASELTIGKTDIGKNAKVGIRSSKVTVNEKVINKGDIQIDDSDCQFNKIQGNGKVDIRDTWLQIANGSSVKIDQTNSIVRAKFNKASHDAFVAKQTKFETTYDGAVNYSTKNNLTFNNNQVIWSVVPMSYHSDKDIKFSNSFTSNVSTSITADGYLKANKANLIFGDSTILKGKKGVIIDHSNATSLGKLQIETDGKYEHHTSHLNTNDDIIILAKKGILSDPTITTKITKHRHWQWHGIHSGHKTTVDVKSTITPSSMHSQNGNVYLYTENGNINIKGTIIDAKKQIGIMAKNGSVHLTDVKGVNYHSVKTHDLFGKHHSKIKYEIDLPSSLLGKENVSIRAKNEIIGRGLVVKTDGKFFAQAKKMTFSRPILETELTESYSGISFGGNSFLSDKYNPTDSLPIYNAAQQMANATSVLGLTAGGVNLGIDAMNKANSFLSDLRNNASFESSFGHLLLGKDPLAKLFSAEISVGSSKSKTTIQTLGNGSIEAKDIELIATDSINIENGYQLKWTNQCDLSAPDISISGATLTTKHAEHSSGVSFGLDLSTLSLNNVSLNMSSAHGYQKNNLVNQLNGPSMSINANTLNLDNAEIDTKF